MTKEFISSCVDALYTNNPNVFHSQRHIVSMLYWLERDKAKLLDIMDKRMLEHLTVCLLFHDCLCTYKQAVEYLDKRYVGYMDGNLSSCLESWLRPAGYASSELYLLFDEIASYHRKLYGGIWSNILHDMHVIGISSLPAYISALDTLAEEYEGLLELEQYPKAPKRPVTELTGRMAALEKLDYILSHDMPRSGIWVLDEKNMQAVKAQHKTEVEAFNADVEAFRKDIAEMPLLGEHTPALHPVVSNVKTKE